MLLILACLLLAPSASLAANPEAVERPNVQYYVVFKYYLEEIHSVELNLNASETITIDIPPPPNGFSEEYVELATPWHQPDQVKVEGGSKVKVSVGMEGFKVRLYGCRKVRLTNRQTRALNGVVRLVVIYSRTETIAITNSTLRVAVERPPFPFTAKNVTIEFKIPSFVPYRFSSIIAPSGIDLLSPETHDKLPPDDLVIAPRRVLIRLSSIGFGDFMLTLERHSPEECAKLVRSIGLFNFTVAPGEEKIVGVPTVAGWNFSHCEVIIASINIFKPYIKGDVRIVAPIVDLAFSTKGMIPIRYIKASYVIKAYVVYSDRFKVVNNLKVPISVYVVPFVWTALGKWTPLGLVIDVTPSLIENPTMAFIDIDLPENGEIEAVYLPNGLEVSKYYDSLLPWGLTSNRTIDVGLRHVRIQVADIDGNRDPGSYTVKIIWKPIQVRVLDHKGRPLRGAVMELFCGEVRLVKDIDGEVVDIKPYKPGVYKVRVTYKNVIVYEGVMVIPPIESCEIICSVYDLKVRVVGGRGQPLEEALVMVTLRGGNLSLTLTTDTNGFALFEQLPIGEYEITAVYKNVKGSHKVFLNEDKTIELRLDVLLEIPYLGYVIKKGDTVLMAIALSAIIAATGLLVRMKRRELVLG